MAHMISLEEALQSMDAVDAILFQSVFQTSDIPTIAQRINQICQTEREAAIAHCEFWEISVSAVFGLVLENGEPVVVKARSPQNVELGVLQAISQVQNALANNGYPCPRALVFPTPIHGSLISIETLMMEGDRCNGHDPAMRRVMATGLADLIQAARPFVTFPDIPVSRFRRSQLWEKPHNALFDFSLRADEAQWIDAIAQQSRAQLRQHRQPVAVGHMDWSAKNMRVKGDRLSAVYDWDSLRLDSECAIVGNAAAGFLVTWYVECPSMVPSPEQVLGFVQDYEAARGQAFTATERQLVAATFLYSIAYTARCEHAIDADGETWTGSFREALKQHAMYAEALQS